MTTPITPTDIGKEKAKIIPKEVIALWNHHIALKYNHQAKTSTVYQKDIETSICLDLNITSTQVMELGYLEIEALYEDYGWKVEYDKPGYNESGKAYFTFKAKR